MNPQTSQFFIIKGYFISDVYIIRYWSFSIILWLQLWWFPSHEMLESWIIISLDVILYFLRGSSIEILTYMRYFTRVAMVPLQPWWFVYLVPISIPFLQPWSFRIIFLILCFSLAIENPPMKWIFLRFKACIYPLIRVFLSISYQLCCKTKLVSFWVHINFRPTFVVVSNPSWPSVFQYTTTNHAPGFIVVNINFPKPGFIGTFTYSWRYMILSLIPS